VMAMRFLSARRCWPGRSSYAAPLVPADEAHAIAALRMLWGNCGSGTVCSPVGAIVVASVGASPCEATRAV
jgi:hypothetical protein